MIAFATLYAVFSSLASNEIKETSFVIFFFFFFFANIDWGETTCLNSGNQKATSYAEVDVSELLVLTWALDFSKLMKCVCVFFIFIASPSSPYTHTYKSRTCSANFGSPNYKDWEMYTKENSNCHQPRHTKITNADTLKYARLNFSLWVPVYAHTQMCLPLCFCKNEILLYFFLWFAFLS